MTGELIKFEHGQDLGAFNVTGDPEEMRLFRVPTLRNLPLTRPYLHVGSAATIPDAIHVMAEVQMQKTLTPENEAAILAFPSTLVGEQSQVVIPILPAD